MNKLILTACLVISVADISAVQLDPRKILHPNKSFGKLINIQLRFNTDKSISSTLFYNHNAMNSNSGQAGNDIL